MVRTSKSLISAGTERKLVEFGRTSLIGKARSQPEKVKQVIDKIRSDGLLPTIETVYKRLQEPLPLGYCNAGVVIEVGSGVDDYAPGDRVASNGPHAEIVSVPKNLCAKIPDSVTDEEAAFTVLCSIGLQGVRLARPGFGEKFIVFGAGLIGLVVVQFLRASGCQVLAVDLNKNRLEIARGFGAETCNATSGNPVNNAQSWTKGLGVDGVLITASAKSDKIIHQSAQACRKRGRIVIVGWVGMNLRQTDFYEKELSCQVSCSYGPGRYDDTYEERGNDYPFAFVRWTEQRNLEAALSAMSTESLSVKELITDRVPLADSLTAYEKVLSDSSSLGVILDHAGSTNPAQTIRVHSWPRESEPQNQCVAAMLGAGNYAKMTMAPNLARTDARMKYVAVRTDVPAASYIASRYGIEHASTDLAGILNDDEVNALFIATGHSSHSSLVCQALDAGKHVFVEKPLAITFEQLIDVADGARTSPDRQVMVGFNRRFSPHTYRIREILADRSEPISMHFSCNAGIIPPDSWHQSIEEGGGRIIGEACHFVDLLSHIAGSPVVSVAAMRMGTGVAVRDDKMSIVLSFKDGSVGTVNYFGNGCKAYPKEILEIYSEGRVIRMENFRRTKVFGCRGFKPLKTKLDKGHLAGFSAFVERVVLGGEQIMELSGLVNVTLATFAAMTSAREGRVVNLDKEYAALSG